MNKILFEEMLNRLGLLRQQCCQFSELLITTSKDEISIEDAYRIGALSAINEMETFFKKLKRAENKLAALEKGVACHATK